LFFNNLNDWPGMDCVPQKKGQAQGDQLAEWLISNLMPDA